MFVLPISRTRVELLPSRGVDDLLLKEAKAAERQLALDWVGRVTSVTAPERLCVRDFEELLLVLRTHELGNLVDADARCRCGERVDVRFEIDHYAEHRRPRAARGVKPAIEPGWFALSDYGVEFRLPTVEDQVAMGAENDPVLALQTRCIRPLHHVARVERAMEALAPLLSGPLEGSCPHCRTTVLLQFDVPSFVVRELRAQAALVYDDVHLLATHYHWSEEHILGLPRSRRQQYVERVRGVGAAS